MPYAKSLRDPTSKTRLVKVPRRRLVGESLEPRWVLDSTVVFNEIMYNPIGPNDALEWIELHNQMSVNMDLSDWSIDGGVLFDIPAGTVIPGGDYLLIAKDPTALAAVSGIASILGPFQGQLDNAGEQLFLKNNNDRLMDELVYSDRGLWPVGPDGSGMSLAKRNPQSGSALPESWSTSSAHGGTPGGPELPEARVAQRSLVFSEVAGRMDEWFQIELVNVGHSPLQLGGHVLRSEGELGGQFVLPEQRLAPGEFVVFDESVLRFDGTAGDRLFLHSPDQTRLLDALRIANRPRARSESAGGTWRQPAETTFGAENRFPQESEIVINEIMYQAPSIPAMQAQAPTYERTPIVAMDSVWRFSKHFTFGAADLPYDPGPDWFVAPHTVDGTRWLEGAGPLGFSRTLSSRLQTRLADPQLVTNFITTYYFELDFGLSAEQLEAAADLTIRHLVDDGAVFYLNGQEVDRFNMPAGSPDAHTLATAEIRLATAIDSETVISKQHLVALPARNRLSVEVHQVSPASDDVVFGMELSTRELIDPGYPATDPVESDEEWIELINRGTTSVELTGWRLDEAVRYTFPPQTSLGPGELLVVAKNADEMATRYPDVAARIVGNYAGQLADGGERIALFDAEGNPADVVHYFDGHPWPWAADGGGSSLELRDPNADNSVPQAWAASEEGGKSKWNTYTYRASGSEPSGASNPRTFHELIVGLLDAGEVLIDDIRVVEEPDGEALELLQNGSFDSDQVGVSPAAWRIIGNHDRSVVAVDPDDSNNRVLRLVATGATEHMHNHAETTLAGGATVSRNKDYEVSFRAKWISGSPQLNTRLYFNRAAHTALLDRPNRWGTPGFPNSTRVANIGPVYHDLLHEPVVPSAEQEVTVSVRPDDPDGVTSMVLYFAVDRGDLTGVPMQRQLDGRFVATIPGQRRSRVVQFFVEGTDARGAVSTFPSAGSDSRALYRVASRELDKNQVHSLRLIMTPTDAALLHADTNVMSNGRLGATVIYNDQEVFYDVGVRLRASGYGRRGPLAGFNIRFHPDQKFRGVHDSIALDRGVVLSNGNSTGPVQGTPGASPHELLFYQIAHHAGRIPAMYDDVVYVEAPRSTNTGLALLKMARYSDVYLDSSYEDGGQGPLLKYELVYHSTQTVDGDPESVKRSPNAVLATDISDLGANKEAYRMNFVLRNNRDRDELDRVVDLGRAFSLSGDVLDAATQEVMDVNQWMRVMALHSLTGGADTYNMGLAHNLVLYVRPDDQRVLAFPWDVDHGFYYSPNAPILGRGGSNLQKVISLPHNRRLFYQHLLDLMETSYNTEYLSSWIEHYTQITGVDRATFFTNYVDDRVQTVTRQLERVAPQIPFEITTHDGNDFVTDAATVTLEGRGWINVHAVRQQDRNAVLDVTWINQEHWQIELPVAWGENRLTLQAYNLRGEPVGSDSIVVTSTQPDRPLQDHLRITEIMYNPPEPTLAELAIDPTWDNDDFEFIELTNTSADLTLDLQGVRISDGPSQPFVFGPDAVVLGPGERLLVVRDQEAFAVRYGAEPSVAGSYEGRLSNDGERIQLEDPFAVTIMTVTYGIDVPWPQQANGAGASLELAVSAGLPANRLGQPDHWRGSVDVGGSPGAKNSSPIDGPAAGDANRDGELDQLDLVFALQGAKYLTGGRATWAEGDWNLDGVFDPLDIVLALQSGDWIA